MARTKEAAKNVSAGLLLFRRVAHGVEVFLVHPGGPFWKNRETGAWSIPKGMVEEGEELLAAATREFHEETGLTPHGPYLPLGTIQQKAGKIVHAWAYEGDADERAIVSNTTRIEMPRGSGHWIEVPEVDRAGWFSPADAREKINPAQADLIDRLLQGLAAG
jgi:predicted NUDIX family NTP pyrophosphohydrolase